MTLPIVTKAVAEISPGPDDATTPNGTFEVVLSAETKDRDGETLLRDEWATPLPDHIPFDVDHGMSVASTVGSGTPRLEADGTLRVSGEYSSIDRGQEVRALVNEGHIRTTSVAYLTSTGTKAAGRKTRELLNGAFVAIPSNRDAVVLSSKAWSALEAETKAGARNSAADTERLQSIHDLAAESGATCSGTKGLRSKAVGTKSIVGSVEAIQDRVRDAIEDAYQSDDRYCGYVNLRGVITEGASYVVFSGYGLTGLDSDATYRQDFADDGAVVSLVGDAVEVDIHEIVAPDADADRESKSLASDPAAPSGPAASDALGDEVAVRAAAIRAYAATAV